MGGGYASNILYYICILHYEQSQTTMKKLLFTFALSVIISIPSHGQYPGANYDYQRFLNGDYDAGMRYMDQNFKQFSAASLQRFNTNINMFSGVQCLATGDYKAAIKFFEEVVDNNGIEALSYLGAMAELGLGMNRDCNLALEFYQYGASRGSEDCQQSLKELNTNGYCWKDEEEFLSCVRRLYAQHVAEAEAWKATESTIVTSPSSSSSSSSYSTSNCPYCNGTGVTLSPSSGGNMSNMVAYYNSQGQKCPYCNSYTKHYHTKCLH